MRRLPVALAGALALFGPGLRAQVTARLHLGALYTSSLVQDSILQPLTVRPDVGLAGGVGVSWPLTSRLEADGELTLHRADVTVREGGVGATINTITTVAVTAGLGAPLVRGLRARVGLGAIRYSPAHSSGIFRGGATTSILGTAVLSYRWPLPHGAAAGAELRFDTHAFSTPGLTARGFTGSSIVHRIGIALSIARRWDR